VQPVLVVPALLVPALLVPVLVAPVPARGVREPARAARVRVQAPAV
jgi:hypothetical protein